MSERARIEPPEVVQAVEQYVTSELSDAVKYTIPDSSSGVRLRGPGGQVSEQRYTFDQAVLIPGTPIFGCPVCFDPWETEPSCEHYIEESAAAVAEVRAAHRHRRLPGGYVGCACGAAEWEGDDHRKHVDAAIQTMLADQPGADREPGVEGRAGGGGA